MPLGRGLGALIPPRIIKKITEETLAQTGERVLEIPVDEIEPNPAQPRKNFSHEEMEELANSIRTYGIIQPLILTQITSLQGGEKGIKYQLVAGERRWRAAKILSLTSVPAIIRKVKDIEKLELTLVEN
ncbi:chromosome partitioning protein ParB, partial [Candidatus Uhrbacteria bacterium CG_4_10_14_0_2_um_filter_41_7]